MPINLGKAHEETRTTTIEYGGESATITFYPKRFTKSLIRKAAESGDNADQVIAMLAPLVADWDIENNGEKVPVTIEMMETFPLDFLKVVQDAVFAEYLPGNNGGATSSRT